MIKYNGTGNDAQEGAEEELDTTNNDDVPGEPVEAEEKEDGEPVERVRKTSKFMTKYERARILGTRALQIRFSSLTFETSIFTCIKLVDVMMILFLFGQHECSCDGRVGG